MSRLDRIRWTRGLTMNWKGSERRRSLPEVLSQLRFLNKHFPNMSLELYKHVSLLVVQLSRWY
jgi:hypothetical protein